MKELALATCVMIALAFSGEGFAAPTGTLPEAAVKTGTLKID